MEEVWKPVKEFGDRYDVSSLGRIRSNCFSGYKGVPIIMKTHLTEHGYIKVGLRHKGSRKQHNIPVHRLQVKAFIPNPENKSQVNHKNGVKNDNRIENLEWCTPSENLKHAHRIGLRNNTGEKNSGAVATEAQVIKARKLRYFGLSLRKISSELNLKMPTLKSAISGRNWSHLNSEHPPLPNNSRYGDWKQGRLWNLQNGKEVMAWLKSVDEERFYQKLFQMDDRFHEAPPKDLPSWARNLLLLVNQ